MCAPEHCLQTWPNGDPANRKIIHLEILEFACLCPLTGQLDLATIVVDYMPLVCLVELKSLKLFTQHFRERKIGHEDVADSFLSELSALLSPLWLRVVVDFNPRGSIKTVIFVEIEEHPGAGPQPRPEYKVYGTLL